MGKKNNKKKSKSKENKKENKKQERKYIKGHNKPHQKPANKEKLNLEENKVKIEKEKNGKLEEIKNLKYVGVGYSDDGIDDEQFEVYKENGERVHEESLVAYSGFKIDVDEGKITDWPEGKGMYLKLHIKVVDTGSYVFYDKNGNTIYSTWGYVPDFLGITSQSYGDYINFDTDIHGYIKDWKENNIKQKIIDYLIKNV